MKLTILGSGTMVPTKERAPSSYLIEKDDIKILLDCGHMTIQRLLERDINLHDIDAACITHFHTDHFSGLFPLVHARFVDDIYGANRNALLQIFGPATTQERFQKMREVMWPEPSETYPLAFTEGVRSADIGSLHLQSFVVNHVPWFPSVGYRITDDERSLVYTGDLGTNQAEEFYDAINGADYLLIESGALKPSPNHFTAQQAVDLAARCDIKNVILTHVRSQWVDQVQQFADAHEHVTLARDGMVMEVSR